MAAVLAMPAPSAATPDVDGQWGAPTTLPVVAVHTALLHTDKVFLLDAWEHPTAVPRLWDQATDAFTSHPVPSGLFCSGHVQLEDGRLLVVGGHAGGEIGIKDTHIFDPVALTWSRVADMNDARWYPSVTLLGDGRAVAISGMVTSGNFADVPEVYDPATDTWTALHGAATTNIREEEYPLSFLMPDGRIFVYAARTGQTGFLDVRARTWTVGPQTPIVDGSAAMYRSGRVLVSGIALGEKAAAVIDLNSPTPGWQPVAAPNSSRYAHNLVPMADGRVLAVGGSTSRSSFTTPVLDNEIWDPATGTWTTVAGPADPRMYHSNAFLQRDGTVQANGGGRWNGPDIFTAEVYSPSYLFKGRRPAITAMPASASLGATVAVATPDSAAIAKVFLARLPSVTHTLNMDPQFLDVPFTVRSGQVDVAVPANANAAPPGYYMLMLVDGAGVPSPSGLLRLVRTTDAAAPTAPASLTASGGSGTARLSWTPSTDDVAVTGYDLHRSTSAGFTPTAANRVAQPSGTSHTDVGLSAGTYHYKVSARDGAGNVGPASREAAAAVTGDTTGPTVSLSAPAAGATVSGATAVTASAADDVGVSGVQFRLDGSPLGAEDTEAPYAVAWDSATATNGPHTLTAVARDAAGNTTSSPPVSVTVANVAPTGLVGAWSFNEGAGATASDSSGRANHGTLSNAAWSTAGRFGGALSFNGSDASVLVPDAASLRLDRAMTLEAWVNPAAEQGYGWRTALLKEAPSTLAYALYANDDADRPAGWVNVDGDRGAGGTSAAPVDTWTHLAATFDGSTLRLYVNGQEVASRSVPGRILSSTGPLRFGGNAVWGEWFHGRLDEVRVYDRALTGAQIRADMATPL